MKTAAGIAESMRRDWDGRARKDAFHYIAAWREGWDAEAFFASGEDDYRRFVEPALARQRCEPRAMTVLELGCGAGRMTRSFACRFARVVACDISAEMLRRAQTLLADFSNIVWIQGDGSSLSGVESNSMGFVFSYIVLQHIPAETLVLQYVREMLRVLKPGGWFLFQLNSGRTPTMNLTGRVLWGLVDGFWALGLPRVSRAIAAAAGLDPEIAGKSWRGAAVPVRAMLGAVNAAGGAVQEMLGEDTPMTWCLGVKSAGIGR